jgi:2-keto-4-pentenoate hydratase/2-oxohepta-3-ene-1,7-dioic acid hydratase in catechol pathway
MRFVSYARGGEPRLAAVHSGQWIDVQDADPSLPSTMTDLFALGTSGLQRIAQATQRATPIARDSVKLLAPVPRPEKVICIGLNYADHAAESGQAIPEEPVVFNKFVTTVRGHDDEITLPRISSKVDYEAELVVVIGRGGKNIPQQRALEHVAGYTCGHDVSARDWQLQKPGGQWLLGKSFDGFAPFGPELVTADEIPDPGNLKIALRLNGKTMQDSSTRQLIFGIDKLIAYLSSVCTLRAGDVIFTGTPPGVGGARKPPVYLQPGDVVEVEIERIGTLRNRFVAEGNA